MRGLDLRIHPKNLPKEMDCRVKPGSGDRERRYEAFMTQQRQLRLGAFMRPASIHTGAWRYPGTFPDANFNLAHLKRFAQTLERARFDAFFMADHLRSEEHTSELQSLRHLVCRL